MKIELTLSGEWGDDDAEKAQRVIDAVNQAMQPTGAEWSTVLHEAVSPANRDRVSILDESRRRVVRNPFGFEVASEGRYWHGRFVVADQELDKIRDELAKVKAEARQDVKRIEAARALAVGEAARDLAATQAELADANTALEQLTEAFKKANAAVSAREAQLEQGQAAYEKLREAFTLTSSNDAALRMNCKKLDDVITACRTLVDQFDNDLAADRKRPLKAEVRQFLQSLRLAGLGWTPDEDGE